MLKLVGGGVLVLSCLAAPLRAQSGGYTLSELLTHVEGRVSEVRILSLANLRCLAVQFGPQSEARLRRTGASGRLIRDLRTVCSRTATTTTTLPPPPPPPPPPAAPSVDELLARGDLL